MHNTEIQSLEAVLHEAILTVIVFHIQILMGQLWSALQEI